MDGDSEVVAEARLIYEQFQADRLAASSLGDMGTWVATGIAPTSEKLRSNGLRSDAEASDWWLVRKAFIRQWGFSIPCAEAVKALVDLSPLVEIGAGSGHWSALLKAAGAEIVSTDRTASGSPGYTLTAGLHFPVEPLDGEAAVRAYQERNVFCSWPTHADEWCTNAASAMRPGRCLALIGKERGGSTGSDTLYDLLDIHFSRIDEIAIPQFPGVDDQLVIYRRH